MTIDTRFGPETVARKPFKCCRVRKVEYEDMSQIKRREKKKGLGQMT